MPLGKEVGLGPRHNVLDGDPAAPLDGKGHSSSKYGWGFVGAGRAACVRKPRPIHLRWRNGRPSQQLLSSCYMTVTIEDSYFVLDGS